MSKQQERDEKFRDQWHECKKEGMSVRTAARALSVTTRSLCKRRAAVEKRLGITLPSMNEPASGFTGTAEGRGEIEFSDIPDSIAPLEDIISRRHREFDRKHAYDEATSLIRVKVHDDKPIAILHFGDPHVDNPGCDLRQLLAHAELCRDVEGLYGANIGDTTDNWVGRLGRLYESHTITRAESWRLAEHFLTLVQWIYVIGGNHDAWSGRDTDPIKWIMTRCIGVYEWHECRIRLEFPSGENISIYARHDWPGRSLYNAAHGAMRGARIWRDDIHICGHRHHSGYGVVQHEDGMLSHCLQVGSYKVIDDYKKEKGFQQQQISPCAVTVLDPDAPRSERVKVYWEPEYAADVLTRLRGNLKEA